MISKSQDAHLEMPQASLENILKNAEFFQITGTADCTKNLFLMRKIRRW